MTLGVRELWDRLRVEPDECAVLSAIVEVAEGVVLLRAASLIVGPRELRDVGWPGWRLQEVQHPAPTQLQLDAPQSFCLDLGDTIAARTTIAPREAFAWLKAALETGSFPALDTVPAGRAQLASATAPIRVSTQSETAAGDLAVWLGRPVAGYHFRRSVEAPPRLPPDRWELDGSTHYSPATTLLGIAWFDSPDGADPSGLLVGRFERRAWLAGQKLHRDVELYDVRIGFEPDRADLADLELEVEERVDGELVIAERLRLEDVDLSEIDEAEARWRDTGDRPQLVLQLPTLGRSVQRTVRLHTRDGELLDERTRFNLLEKIALTPVFDGHRLATTWTGEKRGPASGVERVAGVERMRSQYAMLRREGLSRRLFEDFDSAKALLRRLLERADGELLVVDPWLSDWDLLKGLGRPGPRVLVGQGNAGPPAGFAGRVKRWSGKHQAPFHDRFFLWDGGGVSIGTSAAPSSRLFRLVRIAAPEAAVLGERFALWWADLNFEVV